MKVEEIAQMKLAKEEITENLQEEVARLEGQLESCKLGKLSMLAKWVEKTVERVNEEWKLQ